VDSFLDKAEKRVRLDLLFSELIKYFKIEVKKDQIDSFIDKESKKYKDPDQFKKWIVNQPQQQDQFRMIVLEEQLVENLENVLKSKKKVIKFSELANRKV
jgi:trigger factor